MKGKSHQRTHLKFAVLAVDSVIFTLKDGRLLTRLISICRPPYFPDDKGLPGGLILQHETAEEALCRHILNKSGISPDKGYAEQLYTFSRIDRDPRDRVVAVAYTLFVQWEKLSTKEQINDEHAWWAPVSSAKNLAYDHDEIFATALARLRSRITYTTLISKIMPKEFTLTELEHAYETILKTKLDKRNFRKKIQKLKIVKKLSRKRGGVRARPAQLYQFISNDVCDIEGL